MWRIFVSQRVAAKPIWGRVVSKMEAMRIPFGVSVSRDLRSLKTQVDQSLAVGEKQFIAAGGDGAVHYLVNELMRYAWETQPIIGLLPLGSGCDFSRSFGVPRDPLHAVELLQEPINTSDVDVGQAIGCWGERHFVNVASVGLTAEIVRHAVKLQRLGAARYLASFWRVLPTYLPRTANVSGSTPINKNILTVVANGQYFGGGFRVAPEAMVGDAKLDLLTLSASRVHMPYVLFQLWRVKHLRMRQVTHRKVESTSMDFLPEASVEADGEYLGRGPVSFGLTPKAIQVVSNLRERSPSRRR